MSTELPRQKDMFSGELVDARSDYRQRQDRQRAKPKQMAMFSAQETVQIGVPLRPWLKDLPSPTLALEIQDVRTDEEKERDWWRKAQTQIPPMFDGHTTTDDHDLDDNGRSEEAAEVMTKVGMKPPICDWSAFALMPAAPTSPCAVGSERTTKPADQLSSSIVLSWIDMSASDLSGQRIRGVLRYLVPLLGSDLIEILLYLWKLAKRTIQFKAGEGVYEVLDYHAQLELLDAEGRQAILHKRQKVRFLHPTIKLPRMRPGVGENGSPSLTPPTTFSVAVSACWG